MHYNVIIVGGGAAGYFTAINIKEHNPSLSVAIFEQSKEVLNKVRISGGGRCNVTNSIWEPSELIKNYPRGEKELMGPFHKFACGDTMSWFEDHGVPLKIEDDGRVFPTSDSSESIIACFEMMVKQYGIKVFNQAKLKSVHWEENPYRVAINDAYYQCDNLVFCTGSSGYVWKLLQEAGYEMVSPVPSLFTFNIKDPRLQELMGIAVSKAKVSIPELNIESEGPLLITHWGMSGPAVLKLSAFAARELAEKQYQFFVEVDWMPEIPRTYFQTIKSEQGKKQIGANPLGGLPSRLWKKLLLFTSIDIESRWADLSKENTEEIADALKAAVFAVKGKSTFKEEFVTAGGLDLRQINFKSFESKLHPGVYFAGEVLNIDAITGGFNFQAAWTGAWLIAQDIAAR